MTEPLPTRLLRIDVSPRGAASSGRRIADAEEARLSAANPALTVDRLDLAADAPDFVTGAWIGAAFTDEAERNDGDKAALAASDALVERLEAADTLLISTPIWNFGPPAALKAWIDQVARARRTFKYTESGPVGLLTGKTAIIVATSGGVALGSPADFMTPWLKHVLGFLGIHDTRVIDAGGQMVEPGKVDAVLASLGAKAA